MDRVHERLLPDSGRFGDMLFDRVLGSIETKRGEWSSAERHLLAAEETARREALPWDLAMTLEARAELLAAQGGDADELRAQAARIFLQLGNERNARALTPKGTPVRAAFGLSRRETEVVRLLAAGKSNREIADTLFLSEKTVENHLTSIYAKLDVANRSGAVAFAVRHGLS
jgi:DNA-binding CsgD family transcriptional regulator